MKKKERIIKAHHLALPETKKSLKEFTSSLKGKEKEKAGFSFLLFAFEMSDLFFTS